MFTRKCMSLVGSDNSALSGAELAAAQKALADAKAADYKCYCDNNGIVWIKPKKLFAKQSVLRDENNNPIRFCGKSVNVHANFCSKCGSPAPGGFWVCGGCGKNIGNESESCPYCGKKQHTDSRLGLRDGCWLKKDDVFAERFELSNVQALIPRGLNIEESQSAIMLAGGAVAYVLAPGFYPVQTLTDATDQGNLSLVMVETSEFPLPLCVDECFSKDNISLELHIVAVLKFNPDNADGFMQNLMGNSMYFEDSELKSAISYDSIAHSLIQCIECILYACINQFHHFDKIIIVFIKIFNGVICRGYIYVFLAEPFKIDIQRFIKNCSCKIRAFSA